MDNEDGARHRQLHRFFQAANNFYLANRPLWDLDFSWDGFEWLCADDSAANTVAFTGGDVPDQNVVRARLVDLTYRRPYDLAGTHVSLGRESSNDIVVADINASRRHAELRLNQQGIWVVTDLSSMNGTLVNGVSVASHPLYPGDIVTIGKTDFEFVLV